ncbi:dATP/dGTP diphosphohydrolase domain-containing protein [uncultured Kushneria sp.]|uniref:dATP/dGTP diphosphohydrolase domain-containing protein n=1 Tax=uncultured Kushneria sp. TaxID=905033 RepID=UPI00263742E2|nr:dATP/dGTP diphosphohydrolase domain-containing protein [uncultured Kushneria sp.]
MIKQPALHPVGLKFDSDKPRLDLLFDGMPHALEEVARVMTFGAAKYADHSWQRVENGYTRYLAASIRHALAVSRGETHDAESGLHHLAHEACCVLFRLELALAALREKEAAQ